MEFPNPVKSIYYIECRRTGFFFFNPPADGEKKSFSSPHFHVFSYASCVDLTQISSAACERVGGFSRRHARWNISRTRLVSHASIYRHIYDSFIIYMMVSIVFRGVSCSCGMCIAPSPPPPLPSPLGGVLLLFLCLPTPPYDKFKR